MSGIDKAIKALDEYIFVPFLSKMTGRHWVNPAISLKAYLEKGGVTPQGLAAELDSILKTESRSAREMKTSGTFFGILTELTETVINEAHDRKVEVHLPLADLPGKDVFRMLSAYLKLDWSALDSSTDGPLVIDTTARPDSNESTDSNPRALSITTTPTSIGGSTATDFTIDENPDAPGIPQRKFSSDPEAAAKVAILKTNAERLKSNNPGNEEVAYLVDEMLKVLPRAARRKAHFSKEQLAVQARMNASMAQKQKAGAGAGQSAPKKKAAAKPEVVSPVRGAVPGSIMLKLSKEEVAKYITAKKDGVEVALANPIKMLIAMRSSADTDLMDLLKNIGSSKQLELEFKHAAYLADQNAAGGPVMLKLSKEEVAKYIMAKKDGAEVALANPIKMLIAMRSSADTDLMDLLKNIGASKQLELEFKHAAYLADQNTAGGPVMLKLSKEEVAKYIMAKKDGAEVALANPIKMLIAMRSSADTDLIDLLKNIGSSKQLELEFMHAEYLADKKNGVDAEAAEPADTSADTASSDEDAQVANPFANVTLRKREGVPADETKEEEKDEEPQALDHKAILAAKAAEQLAKVGECETGLADIEVSVEKGLPNAFVEGLFGEIYKLHKQQSETIDFMDFRLDLSGTKRSFEKAKRITAFVEEVIKKYGVDAQHAMVAKVDGRDAIIKTPVSDVIAQHELQNALNALFKHEPAVSRFSDDSIKYASELKHALLEQKALPKDPRAAKRAKLTKRSSGSSNSDAYVSPMVAKQVFAVVLGELGRIKLMGWLTNATTQIKVIRDKAGVDGAVVDKAISIRALTDLVRLIVGAQNAHVDQALTSAAGASLKETLAVAAASGRYAAELPRLELGSVPPSNETQTGLVNLFLGALEQNTKHLSVASTKEQTAFANGNAAAGAGAAPVVPQ